MKLKTEQIITPVAQYIKAQPQTVLAPPRKGLGRRVIGGIFSIFKTLIKSILTLIVVLYIMLWMPWVQIKIGHIFAYAMSTAWDTKVTLERVEIRPLSNFKFYNFFVQDHDQDTLLFAKYAEAQNYNVLSLFKKKIDIGNVIIKDAVFKVQRRPKAEFFNIHFLIAFFEAGEVVEPRPKKFALYMGGADLVNARIHLTDTAIGTSAIITCDTGYVHGHGTMGVDMIGKKVWGDKMHLAGAKITVRVFDKVDIPNVDSVFWDPPVDMTIPYWDVGCEKLLLNDVSFRLINERSDVAKNPNPDPGTLDFNNLDFRNINLDVDTFRLQKEVFTGYVRQIHGIDQNGFELKSLYGEALISPTKIAVTNFKLVTNTSSIGHALVLKYDRYGDFFDFIDKVNITGTFDSATTITFRDLSAFAPIMKENIFIKSNLDNPIMVEGKFKGTVNNFRARDVIIKVGNHSEIIGNLSMNDITIPDAAFMDLDLKKVYTDYADLQRILPFVNLPANMATLGKMNFEGSYTGFFQDFVAYGQLDTRLGRVNSDLQLNLRGGRKRASYKGGLRFHDFDLGTFLDNKNFGHFTAHTQVKGTGLTLETLNAQLQNAKVDSFVFKNYQYEDILIDGLFKQKKFDGDVLSKDPNMDLFVRGIVDLNSDLPKVDILGNIENIDFKKVNITQENLGLHLDTFAINAIGNTVDNIEGNLLIRGIRGHRGDIYSELDRIVISAKNISTPYTIKRATDTIVVYEKTRSIDLRSDILDVKIDGKYNVVDLVRSIENFIKINHPNLYRELYHKEPILPEDNSPLADFILKTEQNVIKQDTIPHQDFNIFINIPNNTKNLTQLIDPNFKSLENISLRGEYNGTDGRLVLEGSVGLVDIGDIGIKNIVLEEGNANGPTFDLKTSVEALNIKGNTLIPNITLQLNAIGDSVHFAATADAVGDVAKSLAIYGKLEINEKLVVLKLDTSQVTLLNEKWTINDNNHIKIGNNILDIKNVALSSGKKRLSVSSINLRRGAKVKIENMDLGWLYGFMEPLPKIDIDGVFSGEATMQNIFTQKGIAANILLDTLIINNDYWGSNSRLLANADSIKSTFHGLFTHSSNFADSLWLTANFTPEFATKDKFLKNLLDINATVEGAKAKILEYFLKEQISETEGGVDAKARVFGNIDGKKTVMNIEGDGIIKGAKTKVNFLQTKYVLADGKIKIDNSGFHIVPSLKLQNGKEYASGGIPVHEQSDPSKTGHIGGSLVHDHLKNFGLDIVAVLDNMLAMNTTIKDNSTFYGTVYASGALSFTGPFEKLKLRIEAVTEDKTVFNLPLGGPLEVSENNYIKFVNKQDTTDSTGIQSIKNLLLSGLDLEIIVDVKPNALARLIIDEKAGDVIEGRGKSDNLRISYSPSGELKMFGTYEITEGKYLFTFKNIINKPFEVKPGGTVTWGENDGDPFRAQLDIEAAYEKNLGVSNLVKSYTNGNPELTTLANQPCKVELKMNMKGELFSPEINFSIDVTDVPARLQNPVSLALRTIEADNNELNRQVFGIIALQQFLPLENAGGVNVVSSGISTGISTVSELVSQQLSLYINDLISGAIKDVDFISSLEFDFNFNIRDTENQTINSRTSNVRLGSDVKFLNDKLRVYAGANMDIAGDDPMVPDANTNYIGGDFIVEYYLTNDGQLKVKAYNRTESTILGRSTRTGVGISWRKEFNTLQDLIDEAKTNKEKRQKKKHQNEVKKYTTQIKKLEEDILTTTDEKKKAKLIGQKDNAIVKRDAAQAALAVHTAEEEN